jgi:surfactin synthase thioesterase subunit
MAPGFIKVMPVDLPGRATRIRESLLTDLHAMADDIYGQLSGQLNEPYCLYGHSMGGWLTSLLTRKILAAGAPPPLRLFVTGCAGPSVANDEPPHHLLPKEAFIARLDELGGCPPSILEDPVLMDFFEPILRADFQAVEKYQYQEAPPFAVPVTVLVGLHEETTYAEAQAWQKETTLPVTVRQFPGKHFFIYEHEAEIMQLISTQLETNPHYERAGIPEA